MIMNSCDSLEGVLFYIFLFLFKIITQSHNFPLPLPPSKPIFFFFSSSWLFILIHFFQFI